MSEASIMGQFRHPNVILLVGVVTISTYSVHVFVYSFVCGLLLFLLFVCLFLLVNSYALLMHDKRGSSLVHEQGHILAH